MLNSQQNDLFIQLEQDAITSEQFVDLTNDPNACESLPDEQLLAFLQAANAMSCWRANY